MRKLKGSSDFIILIGVFIILFTIMGAGHLFAGPVDNTEYVVRENDLNTVQNNLKTAKSYLLGSLDFSVYQSFEDIESIDLTGSPDYSEFSEKIKDNLNSYTKSGVKNLLIMDKNIKLPNYKNIELFEAGSSMFVKAVPDNDLVYQEIFNAKDLSLQKESAELIGTYKISIFGMADSSSKIFDDIKSNSCDDRKYDGPCGNYKCTAVSDDSSGECITEIKVTYEGQKYPVIESGKPKFKYLGIKFLHKETASSPAP